LTNFSQYLENRLLVFLKADLIKSIPNKWQLLQGSVEMMPYVVIPDVDDSQRYRDAKYGHPMLRTPIILGYIGSDHFKIGSGLGASCHSIVKHLNIVHHQIFPSYDLQLLQTHPLGLEKLRLYMGKIEYENSDWANKIRKKVGNVLPDASNYRINFLKPGGWIDRASNFDYESINEIPDYLRKDFFSLISFINYCNTLPKKNSFWKKPLILLKRSMIKFTN